MTFSLRQFLQKVACEAGCLFLGIQIGLTGYSAPYLLRICSVSSPYKGTFIGRRYGLDTARTRPGYGAGPPSERHEFSLRKASLW